MDRTEVSCMIAVPKSEQLERENSESWKCSRFIRLCGWVDPSMFHKEDSICEKDGKLKLKASKACVHIYLHVGSRWQSVTTRARANITVSRKFLHENFTQPSHPKTRKIWSSSTGKRKVSCGQGSLGTQPHHVRAKRSIPHRPRKAKFFVLFVQKIAWFLLHLLPTL